ncbi:unnamed protein product [Vitrella brassicaformis CCMP3155]|uniref:Thioredoxin reductase n=1 Tax=Vitrella brassicaformis (strain CCMP3155) TaxID=1169540 RepID=A0A0G4FWZ3_VITBC|nr:unnamed protein product [Vitrella brassicaformis CCMP3155]|eukprot:CEM19674.1 unnamed protein product [Vitrella brassicaformis CCMP3155]
MRRAALVAPKQCTLIRRRSSGICGLSSYRALSSAASPRPDYDLVVIGGGSGGMAAAKEAANHGARVALFDYVKPSPQGTTWGLGGTCVNVGCIPKKLMHYAGLIGASFYDGRHLGWQLPEVHGRGHSGIVHEWGHLVETVQNKVRQLSFSYKAALRSNKVKYVNALARFESPRVIEYGNASSGERQKLTTDKVIIAVGGRPTIPEDIPGAVEHGITSDDIFSLKRPPGRTLVVGGSYIALETAGFLNELNFDVSVAVRSIVLRGFDRQCSEKVAQLMAELGVRFIYSVTPISITRKLPDEGGLPCLEVKLRTPESGNVVTEVYNTVVFATGRTPETAHLGLDAVGVSYDPQTSKIDVNDVEQTSAGNIYAVGDCIPQLELTPVAVKAGELLARRLYGGSTEKMDYEMVPTTVFTPFEYGCVGLSEEQAEERYGKDAIETLLLEFENLELSAVHRPKVATARSDEFDVNLSATNLSKLVCLRNDNNRVVGFHYVGLNAGEVTQGFALALRLGATKSDFDKMIGIHPTDAESYCGLTVTRRSGESFVAAGGCGGGKCG